MILTKFRVKNYLSINGECEVPTDPKVTVLLGANDHGKSNLLRSLEHLNIDRPILDTDENWDSKGAKIEFEFHLNDGEAASLTDAVERMHDRYLGIFQEATSSDEEELSESSPIIPAPVLPSVSVVGAGQNSIVAAAIRNVALAPKVITSSKDDEDPEELLAEYNFAKSAISRLPILVLSRDGVGSALSIAGRALSDLPEEFYDVLEEMIPRVELFKTFSGELQDSVTAEEIGEDDSEFLQGIFFYAGLDPLNCKSLFIQDDETDKTLEEASARLDEALRRRWAQGVDLDLHFQLKHRGNSIELLVEDPAVRRRKVRMSQRSAGVTQFFRLSIVLHARRHKNPSNSYIYVFDEPGVFLHPKGQKDLLAVFEQLAVDTQIVYATHSLFMLNQNFPERHRLIAKSESSTVVDSKPYRANWKYAVDALGVRLTANILFSPNILLVEGDSDPIYIYEMLRLLNDADELDADANLLGIMSYGDLPNLRFLIQTWRFQD